MIEEYPTTEPKWQEHRVICYLKSLDITVPISYRAESNPDNITSWWVGRSLNIQNEGMAKLVFSGLNHSGETSQEVHDLCLAHFKRLSGQEETPEASQPQPSCETCRFNGGKLWHNAPTLICVRRAPVVTSEGVSEWASVAPEKWCGEFEERTLR